MTVDLRLQVIRSTVAELVAFENEVAGRLERAQHLSSGHPDSLAAIQRLRPMVQTHRDQLATYLKDFGGAEPSRETTSPQSTSREATALSEVLRDLCLAFHRCALSYAMLHEVAARLYEPRLREIAPEHLKAHADAALSTARLLPGVVAWQLAQDGLHCACTCPMCGLGACGCVAWVTETLIDAWRDAAPIESLPPGFILQSPRPGSELARAGVQGGELILAVDGQQVHGRVEIQAALRKRTLGEEVRFLTQRGSESPRELIVRHAGDYPKT
jgi:hypothetical protein